MGTVLPFLQLRVLESLPVIVKVTVPVGTPEFPWPPSARRAPHGLHRVGRPVTATLAVIVSGRPVRVLAGFAVTVVVVGVVPAALAAKGTIDNDAITIRTLAPAATAIFLLRPLIIPPPPDRVRANRPLPGVWPKSRSETITNSDDPAPNPILMRPAGRLGTHRLTDFRPLERKCPLPGPPGTRGSVPPIRPPTHFHR